MTCKKAETPDTRACSLGSPRVAREAIEMKHFLVAQSFVHNRTLKLDGGRARVRFRSRGCTTLASEVAKD